MIEKHGLAREHPGRFASLIIVGILLLIILGLYLSSVFILRDMASRRVEKFATTPEGLGLEDETITATSADGIPLKAWYLATNSPQGLLVILHGMDGMDASSLLPQAKFLYNAGYASIVLDMRAHGRSGGDHIGFAFEEPQDVCSLLDWIVSQTDLKDVPLVLLGFSMGGATAIRTAAIRPDVDAVISVSSYSSMDRMLGQGMTLMGAPPELVTIYTPFLRLGLETLYGVNPTEASPEHDIPAISPRPVLLIHGTADSQVPLEQAYIIKKAGGENVELWIAEGADHLVFQGDGTGLEDADYRQTILDFLDRALAGK